MTSRNGAAGIGRPTCLPELLAALAVLPLVERARLARLLADRRTTGALAALGDAAVVEWTRRESRAAVAEALGVSVSAIGKAVHRHNTRSLYSDGEKIRPAIPVRSG